MLSKLCILIFCVSVSVDVCICVIFDVFSVIGGSVHVELLEWMLVFLMCFIMLLR